MGAAKPSSAGQGEHNVASDRRSYEDARSTSDAFVAPVCARPADCGDTDFHTACPGACHRSSACQPEQSLRAATRLAAAGPDGVCTIIADGGCPSVGPSARVDARIAFAGALGQSQQGRRTARGLDAPRWRSCAAASANVHCCAVAGASVASC
jgi:hypothetical protein